MNKRRAQANRNFFLFKASLFILFYKLKNKCRHRANPIRFQIFLCLTECLTERKLDLSKNPATYYKIDHDQKRLSR